jgi:hypothetical protein
MAGAVTSFALPHNLRLTWLNSSGGAQNATSAQRRSVMTRLRSQVHGLQARGLQFHKTLWPPRWREAKPPDAAPWQRRVRQIFLIHICQTACCQTACRRAISASRHDMPEFMTENCPSADERAREGRVLVGPAVRVQTKSTRQNHRYGRTTGLPRAMALRLIRDLPGDRLSCPRVATMRCAHCAGRQHRDARTTRLHRPHIISRRAKAPDEPRPPHPRLTCRDDRDTPLSLRRDARMKPLIWG